MYKRSRNTRFGAKSDSQCSALCNVRVRNGHLWHRWLWLSFLPRSKAYLISNNVKLEQYILRKRVKRRRHLVKNYISQSRTRISDSDRRIRALNAAPVLRVVPFLLRLPREYIAISGVIPTVLRKPKLGADRNVFKSS